MNEFENKHTASNVNDKQYKTKDYVRRASNKYRQKKYKEDEEYRKDKIAKSILNYEKNKDKIKNKNKDDEEYKTKRKLYMREYRAKKKAEKQLAEQQQSGRGESTSNGSHFSNVVEK